MHLSQKQTHNLALTHFFLLLWIITVKTYSVLGGEPTNLFLEPCSMHYIVIREHAENMTAAILSNLCVPNIMFFI